VLTSTARLPPDEGPHAGLDDTHAP
jgi:hypothetical protein